MCRPIYVGCVCRRVVQSKGSQWHERFCRNPEFMGLNPSWVEIFGCFVPILTSDFNKKE